MESICFIIRLILRCYNCEKCIRKIKLLSTCVSAANKQQGNVVPYLKQLVSGVSMVVSDVNENAPDRRCL